MVFYFQNTEKDIIVTGEIKKIFSKMGFVDLVKRKVEPDKVRDHCHLTGSTEDLPITIVILVLHRNLVILFQINLTLLVIMVVICFLKNYFTKKMINRNEIVYLKQTENIFQ